MAVRARRRAVATLQAWTGNSLGSGIAPMSAIVNTPPFLSSLAGRSYHPTHSIPKDDVTASAGWTSNFPLTRSTSSITQPSLSGSSGSESDNSKPAIRKEKVEAALRSSPQRGRKRTNLNPMERQELIRNRNREHAKETRLRKNR